MGFRFPSHPIIAIALLASLACTAQAAPRPSDANVAAALGSHPLARLGGGTLLVPSLKGVVVVLNFWASWCGPCRRELPLLAKLNTELSPRGGRVVAVSIDADPRNAASFARRVAPGLAIYHDGPDGLARTLDLPALPYTIVLDRDGAVVWAGGGTDVATLDQLAAAACRASAAPALAGETTDGGSR